jgi:membrane-bound serine protease (ClpP class)
LAIVLFVLEATITSHGILAVGGIVAMIAGGLMLVQGPIPQLRIHLGTVLAVTLPVAFITIFLVRLVMLSHRRKSVVGEEGMIGIVGMARTDINLAGGSVFVRGELWNAYSPQSIPEGSSVRVTGVHGLRLEVEHVNEDAAPTASVS